MQTFDSIIDARNALMDFRASHPKAIPDNLVDRFRELTASPSPVDQIVRTGEFLYANRADLPNEAKDLCGALIAFATLNAWHGLLDNDRGNQITQAMRRDIGDKAPAGAKFPDPKDDPAGLEEYAPPPPAPVIEPAETK